jgi:hypothetical protein
LFVPLRLISQSTPLVTGADKPQVSALKQNRGKFVKKPNDSIRRKFSIDAEDAIEGIFFDASTISKPYQFRFGNLAFTIHGECGVRTTQNRLPGAVFRSWNRRLSVRLSSL